MTTLSARDLSVVERGVTLLDRASLDAEAGAFIGVLGPNGAGKSTLLRALAGLDPRARGGLLWNGAPADSLPAATRARLRAWLPQQREIVWNLTAETVVALGRFAYGAPLKLDAADARAVERALAAARLTHLKDREAATLSGGEAARMHLARALAAEAPILIADEPIAALDPRCQIEVMEILRAKAAEGGVVIAALHDLDLARRYCARIVVMSGGRMVADGNPIAALSDRLLRDVFGVTADSRGFRLASDASA